MAVVIFGTSKKLDVSIIARVAGNGPGVSAICHLMDTNNPSKVIELPPPSQQGAEIHWTISAASLSKITGAIDHLELVLRNTSYYAGSVTEFVRAMQSGKPLKASLPQNKQGEATLGVLAAGESGTHGIGLYLR